jgi:hypothetical protein
MSTAYLCLNNDSLAPGWHSQPQTSNAAYFQESRLRRFCKRYWGKGDEGRLEIYKTATLLIPQLDDDDVLQPQSSVDHPKDEGGTSGEPETSGAVATNDVDTSYMYISLSEFPGFFGHDRSEILLRDEYPILMEHIRGIEAGKSVQVKQYGAVVIGRPGIGQEPSRLYLHVLTSV